MNPIPKQPADGAPPPQTPLDLLRRQVAERPHENAVEADDGTMTWLELGCAVAAVADLLRRRGIARGDRVIVAWEPSCAWVVSALAAVQAGAIVVPVDPTAPPGQAQRLSALIEPRLVLGTRAATDAYGGEAIGELPQPATSPELGRLDCGPDAPALIVTTSGTTGKPKAAVHSVSTMLLAGEGFAHWLRLTPADRLLCCLPLYHVNAIFYSWLGSLAAGATLIFVERFSVSRFWDDVKRTRATEVNLIGSLLEMLVRRTTPADAAGHSLRVVYSAGASASVQERFEESYGVRVVEGYGLSETPFGCVNGIHERRVGSLGRPRQHPRGAVENELAVVAPDGRRLGPHEEGEIVIRNGAMLLEYWRDPEATAEAFSDGWLRTRDLGTCDDDGYFWFRGRLGDVIRRNGVNISPAEIERCLAESRWVEDTVIVGVPNEVMGEEVVAVVVPAHGMPDEEAARRVLDDARAMLRREQLPDRVVVAGDLPLTVTGRIQRAKLREWLTTRKT